MRLWTSEIAAWTGGRLEGADVAVDGVAHDSRSTRPGELFVPVVADRDGHEFIAAALAAGAVATLTQRPLGGDVLGGASAVHVDDTVRALQVVATRARDRLGELVVGITGSVGKTTTKDLAAAVLAHRYRTSASARSHNNEIGVPLTVLGAPDGTEALVLEMGARGHGHIAELCAIGRPTVGVVTAVERVHTELFGDVEEVAEAKAELVEALPASGVAVLNLANLHVAAMAARTPARVVRVGPGGEVAATEVRVDDDLRPRFRLVSDWGAAEVHLGIRGGHNVINGLLAAAVGLVHGIGPEEVAAALGEAAGSPWRMELHTTPGGARVVNDAYNAGPASVRAALRSLAALGADRRTAVLGPMAELGDHGPDEHRGVAALAAELGIGIIAVAAPDYGPGVIHVADREAALAALGRPGPGDAVLVKGSRVAGLEAVADRLVRGAGSAG